MSLLSFIISTKCYYLSNPRSRFWNSSKVTRCYLSYVNSKNFLFLLFAEKFSGDEVLFKKCKWRRWHSNWNFKIQIFFVCFLVHDILTITAEILTDFKTFVYIFYLFDVTFWLSVANLLLMLTTSNGNSFDNPMSHP